MFLVFGKGVGVILKEVVKKQKCSWRSNTPSLLGLTEMIIRWLNIASVSDVSTDQASLSIAELIQFHSITYKLRHIPQQTSWDTCSFYMLPWQFMQRLGKDNLLIACITFCYVYCTSGSLVYLVVWQTCSSSNMKPWSSLSITHIFQHLFSLWCFSCIKFMLCVFVVCYQ